MADSNNLPSLDPANNETLIGSIRFAYKKFLQNTDGMLPAKVIAYDRTTNRANIQIQIMVLTTDGSTVSRPQIASIPVLVMGGGNTFISFPIKPGDLGWLAANDRDISLFLQNYAEQKPNTLRIKSFSDGVFIPDIMHNFTIDDTDTDNLVISTKDGTNRITIGDSGIKILSGNISLEDVIVVTDTTVTIEKPTTINGTLHVTGVLTGDAGANLSGTITLTGGPPTGNGVYHFVTIP